MSEQKNPIPIKNLFYMLCYAWDVLAIKDDMTVGSDEYTDAYDLLARVFSFGLGNFPIVLLKQVVQQHSHNRLVFQLSYQRYNLLYKLD